MISVIIPVYNTGQYLHKCLTSLAGNTYSDIEIICVDDGSTDDSLNILRQYQDKDDRIVVISQENGGVSKARNAGLTVAKGEYICFVDSDDWVHSQYLEALLGGIVSSETNMAVVRYQEIYDYDQEMNEKAVKDIASHSLISLEQLLNNYKLKSRCWGKLYKKDLVTGLEFKEGIRLGEDSIFVYEYLNRLSENEKICIIDAALYYYYHEREDSAIHLFDYREEYKLVDYLANEMVNLGSWLKTVYAIEGIKKLLRIRFSVSMNNSDNELQKECNKLMKNIFKSVTINELSVKWYIVYRTFYLFPWTYRFFMVWNDPSLLKAKNNKGK